MRILPLWRLISWNLASLDISERGAVLADE
jgi:hypothetical protein